ncbi:hypothetical protein ACWEVD_13405 [Nocardia thailandica]|uniref:Lipoprotein n=1 Tax=Nocardia thailandica TaxID=257275 RepID=A0ABW6PU59_9NOCA
MTSPHRRAACAAALAAVTAATLAGCGSDEETPTPPPPPPVTTASADDLCGMMRSQVGDWQALGQTSARIGFTGTMTLWTRNGNDAANVARDRGVVDDITARQCPELRQKTITAVGTPDLATALGGF